MWVIHFIKASTSEEPQGIELCENVMEFHIAEDIYI